MADFFLCFILWVRRNNFTVFTLVRMYSVRVFSHQKQGKVWFHSLFPPGKWRHPELVSTVLGQGQDTTGILGGHHTAPSSGFFICQVCLELCSFPWLLLRFAA